jgi:hypothetical protein
LDKQAFDARTVNAELGAAGTMCITHIGGPTALIEVGPWRLLTDPTFDAPGRRYPFALGTSSRKLAGPAIAARRHLAKAAHGEALRRAVQWIEPGVSTEFNV